MIASISFGIIAYLAGNVVFADYLQIHYVVGTGELAIICGALIWETSRYHCAGIEAGRLIMGGTDPWGHTPS